MDERKFSLMSKTTAQQTLSTISPDEIQDQISENKPIDYHKIRHKLSSDSEKNSESGTKSANSRSINRAEDGKKCKTECPISFEEALQIGQGSNMRAKKIQPPIKNPDLARTNSNLTPMPTFTSISSPPIVKPFESLWPIELKPAIYKAPMTFTEQMEVRSRPNYLAFRLGGSLSFSRRPCHDFFYKEVLVTRYLRLRSTSNQKAETNKQESSTVEIEYTSPKEEYSAISTDEPDVLLIAESIKKAMRIRSSTETAEMMEDDDENEEDILQEIPKIYDEPIKRQLLARIIDVISSQRIVECTAFDVNHGISIRHVGLQRNAAFLRRAFGSLAGLNMKLGAWAHSILLQKLPLHFLVDYLQLLRYMRQMAPSLTEMVTTGQTDGNASQLARKLVFHKVTDPSATSAAKSAIKPLDANFQLILVPPTLQHPTKTRQRAHDYFYKILLPMIGQTHSVKLMLPNRNYTVAETGDLMLVNIRDKITEVKKAHRDAKIILVGWGTSCLLNCKAAQTMPAVFAILNLAFPVVCATGYRGDVDDDILTLTCPTLFVVGQFSIDSNFDALQDLRDNMRSQTGLIVLGSSNSNLYVSPKKLLIERLTLRAVHRVILDHIVDYIEKALANPDPKTPKIAKPLPTNFAENPSSMAKYSIDKVDVSKPPIFKLAKQNTSYSSTPFAFDSTRKSVPKNQSLPTIDVPIGTSFKRKNQLDSESSGMPPKRGRKRGRGRGKMVVDDSNNLKMKRQIFNDNRFDKIPIHYGNSPLGTFRHQPCRLSQTPLRMGEPLLKQGTAADHLGGNTLETTQSAFVPTEPAPLARDMMEFEPQQQSRRSIVSSNYSLVSTVHTNKLIPGFRLTEEIAKRDLR